MTIRRLPYRRTACALLAALFLFQSSGSGQSGNWDPAVAVVSVNQTIVRRSPGTAVVVSLQRDVAYLVTSAHVVDGDPNPVVRFLKGTTRPYQAKVVAVEKPGPDQSRDRRLALLAVSMPPPGLTDLGETYVSAGAGEPVSYAGFPAAIGDYARLDTTVAASKGEDLFLSRESDGGFSGGPVIRKGRMVGLIYGNESGYGTAVSHMAVRRFLNQLRIPWKAPVDGVRPKDLVSDNRHLAGLAEAHRLPELYETDFVVTGANQCYTSPIGDSDDHNTTCSFDAARFTVKGLASPVQAAFPKVYFAQFSENFISADSLYGAGVKLRYSISFSLDDNRRTISLWISEK
jgi:hypothetical protein